MQPLEDLLKERKLKLTPMRPNWAKIRPDLICSVLKVNWSDLIEFWPSFAHANEFHLRKNESSKVTARVQSNYFPTDIGCRLLPPPQSNLSDTTLNYRIETYYNNNDLVPDFIPKNSSNLNQVKEDLFGQFGSFKNVSLSWFESLSQTCPKSNHHLSDHHLSRFWLLYVPCP